ncbi:uncharacterized protein LOC130642044 [Hydractinia symbiolongicarpus]|uniref:uncharacterized protein LOC130642044 n=1 Tax=Hydractinia symbiolongicarpus TaxID=13093 RepID=UPI00254FE227|nr:uncharacterized protein LOC130642044 [Hydractinia symbiolongicarpus]
MTIYAYFIACFIFTYPGDVHSKAWRDNYVDRRVASDYGVEITKEILDKNPDLAGRILRDMPAYKLRPLVRRLARREMQNMARDPWFFSGYQKPENCPSTPDPKCKIVANGCGPQSLSKIEGPFTTDFVEACNKHDVCYSCLINYSWTQSKCDEKFKSDMNMICDCDYYNSALTKASCRIWASFYYGLVSQYGSTHVTTKTYDWCENSCVNARYSPSVSL